MMTIRIRASPIDFSSTVRNGGESIWDSAWAAASSIMVLRGFELSAGCPAHKSARVCARRPVQAILAAWQFPLARRTS